LREELRSTVQQFLLFLAKALANTLLKTTRMNVAFFLQPATIFAWRRQRLTQFHRFTAEPVSSLYGPPHSTRARPHTNKGTPSIWTA
jgi:hypothetical protein